MRESGGVTGWLMNRISTSVREEVFEPAYHDLLASHLASGRRWAERRSANADQSRAPTRAIPRVLAAVVSSARAAVFRIRVFVLTVQTLRLQVRGAGDPEGGEARWSGGAESDPSRTGWSGTRAQLPSREYRKGVGAEKLAREAGQAVREIGLAVRGLARRPGLTSAAVLTLALGIGATAAIFGAVNGILFRSLPFADSDELVTLDIMGDQGFPISLSMPNYVDWRERNRAFETLAAWSTTTTTRTTPDAAEVIEVNTVVGQFFETLDVAPVMGRWISAEETEPGAERIAVLGYGLWQGSFAASPDVLGSSILLNGTPYDIVGVMPAGFGLPSLDVAVYVPMGVFAGLPWTDRQSSFGARPIARLRDGASLQDAQRDMDRIAAELDGFDGYIIESVTVRSLAGFYAGGADSWLILLMGTVGFVLLIAGVNVANLLLVRGEERRAEIAVRMALGAGRGAVVRQLLIESVVVASAGATVGLAVAFVGVAYLRANLPLPDLLLAHVRVDGIVLAFTALIATAGGLVFGMIPAFRVSARSPIDAMRESARVGIGRVARRLRSALVVAEVALALVLLIGAGLMLRSLSALRAVDTGFHTQDVLTARLVWPSGSLADRETWLVRHQALLDRVRAQPGVRSAAATLLVPLTSRSWELLIVPEGLPLGPGEGESVLFNIVSDDYFATLDVPIVHGRDFEPADRNGSRPVAIVDQTLADLLWPGENPIGRRFTLDAEHAAAENGEPVWREVVGVVPNLRHYDVRSPSRIQVYVPMRQSLGSWPTSMYIALRTDGDAAAFGPRLRDAAREVERQLALSDVATLDSRVADNVAIDRVLGGLLSAFGALALGLAAIGVFGVMSLLVTTQRREIGLRLALGARPPRVLVIVIARMLLLAGGGAILGLAAALALSRLLRTFLFEVSPLDGTVFASALCVLVATAVAASLSPAFRAARVDPMVTLRSEG